MARKIGVEIPITTNTPMTLNNINNQARIVAGRMLSTTSTSFEKRLMIRPNGVVSKKDIGMCMELSSSLSWDSSAAFKHPRASSTDPINSAIDCTPPSAPYTPRYMSRTEVSVIASGSSDQSLQHLDTAKNFVHLLHTIILDLHLSHLSIAHLCGNYSRHGSDQYHHTQSGKYSRTQNVVQQVHAQCDDQYARPKDVQVGRQFEESLSIHSHQIDDLTDGGIFLGRTRNPECLTIDGTHQTGTNAESAQERIVEVLSIKQSKQQRSKKQRERQQQTLPHGTIQCNNRHHFSANELQYEHQTDEGVLDDVTDVLILPKVYRITGSDRIRTLIVLHHLRAELNDAEEHTQEPEHEHRTRRSDSRDASNDQIKTLAVSDLIVFELNLSFCGPSFVDCSLLPLSFSRKYCVFVQTFHSYDIRLDFSRHTHKKAEMMRYLQRITNRNSNRRLADCVPSQDGKKSCEQDNQAADQFQPYTEPPIGHNSWI
uniref:Uncharacterized protein n=1 Tax=Anopheles culicifacies TaxID=139723 RepID=A0A182M6X0_9DIPT